MNCLLYPMQLFPKCIGWLARWLFAPGDDHRQSRGQVGQAPAAHKNWLWRQPCEALLFAYCWTELGFPRSEVLLLNTPGDDGYDLSSSVYQRSRNSRSPLSLPLPLGEHSQHYRYVVWSFPAAATSACRALESWHCAGCWGCVSPGGCGLVGRVWLLPLGGWGSGERMNLNHKGEGEVVGEIFIKTVLLSKLLLCCGSHRLLSNPLSLQTCLVREFQQAGFTVLSMRSERLDARTSIASWAPLLEKTRRCQVCGEGSGCLCMRAFGS